MQVLSICLFCSSVLFVHQSNVHSSIFFYYYVQWSSTPILSFSSILSIRRFCLFIDFIYIYVDFVNFENFISFVDFNYHFVAWPQFGLIRQFLYLSGSLCQYGLPLSSFVCFTKLILLSLNPNLLNLQFRLLLSFSFFETPICQNYA